MSQHADHDNEDWNGGNFDAATSPAFNTAGEAPEWTKNGSGACHNCGQDGHMAKECPEPRKEMGACFNCGEEGHSKAECPNPRVFTGTCRRCERQGHMAHECPDKPVEKCYNCRQEGHKTQDCNNKRFIDRSEIDTKDEATAWSDLVQADKTRDLDDIREAIDVYIKAAPNTTYRELEEKFRKEKLNTHIVGLEKEIEDSFTLVDLQGTTGRKFTIGLFFSANTIKRSLQPAWPATPEMNLERLENAGKPLETGIVKCGNCGEFGHPAKFCKQEKEDKPRIEVKCFVCDESGHRARDCTKERYDPFTCRNCKQPGHQSRDCPEPPSMENVECKNCGEKGHFARDCPTKEPDLCRNCSQEGHRAKDCPEPRNMATVTCRNCDAEGHMSRDCPKPRDYSRVQCKNCGEMGHTVVRCKKPVQPDDLASPMAALDTNDVEPMPAVAKGADPYSW